MDKSHSNYSNYSTVLSLVELVYSFSNFTRNVSINRSVIFFFNLGPNFERPQSKIRRRQFLQNVYLHLFLKFYAKIFKRCVYETRTEIRSI